MSLKGKKRRPGAQWVDHLASFEDDAGLLRGEETGTKHHLARGFTEAKQCGKPSMLAAFSFHQMVSLNIQGWRKFERSEAPRAAQEQGLPAAEASPCRPLAAHSVKTLQLGLGPGIPGPSVSPSGLHCPMGTQGALPAGELHQLGLHGLHGPELGTSLKNDAGVTTSAHHATPNPPLIRHSRP